MSTKKIAYNNKYNKNKYDQLLIRVKKGEKETIKNYAKQNGMNTTEYIKTAIKEYNKIQQTEIIQNLKEKIYPIAQKYNINKIILYGSRARGDYRQESDYDLYIPDSNFNGLIELAQFEEEIEQKINGKTDITTINENDLDDYMKKEIGKDGIKIYERKQR